MTCAGNRLLIKIAHSTMFLKGRPARTSNSKSRRAPANGELLGTDFAANACQRLSMKKKGKSSITPPRTTVASVNKEMQKPRLTESVRNDGKKLLIPSTGPQKAQIGRRISRAEPH
jgi:hypothetical protein